MAEDKMAPSKDESGFKQTSFTISSLIRNQDAATRDATLDVVFSKFEQNVDNSGDVVLLSSFEERVESILNALQIKHTTQNHINYSDESGSKTFIDENGQQRPYIYTPDFNLNSPNYQGKTVILEPHGGKYFNDKFFDKMIRFMDSKEHDSTYYLIMITEKPVAEINAMLADYARRRHIKRKLDVSNICDKMVNTRMRSDEDMRDHVEGNDPVDSAKPRWNEAQRISDQLGGMKRFDDREFIRTLIRLKEDDVVEKP